ARIAHLEAQVRALRVENASLRSGYADVALERDEALEQQTATAEVLRVIAASPANLQEALQAILDTAALLCDAPGGTILQLRASDGRLSPRYAYGVQKDLYRQLFPGVDAFTHAPGLEVTRDNPGGVAFLDRRTVHIPDMAEAVLSEFPGSRGGQSRDQ